MGLSANKTTNTREKLPHPETVDWGPWWEKVWFLDKREFLGEMINGYDWRRGLVEESFWRCKLDDGEFLWISNEISPEFLMNSKSLTYHGGVWCRPSTMQRWIMHTMRPWHPCRFVASWLLTNVENWTGHQYHGHGLVRKMWILDLAGIWVVPAITGTSLTRYCPLPHMCTFILNLG